MIIEREVKPILHRQKCSACGYYTIHRAVPQGERACDSCTHCGHTVELLWFADLKAAIKNFERLLNDLSEIYPELNDLKEPGDHIMLD